MISYIESDKVINNGPQRSPNFFLSIKFKNKKKLYKKFN